MKKNFLVLCIGLFTFTGCTAFLDTQIMDIANADEIDTIEPTYDETMYTNDIVSIDTSLDLIVSYEDLLKQIPGSQMGKIVPVAQQDGYIYLLIYGDVEVEGGILSTVSSVYTYEIETQQVEKLADLTESSFHHLYCFVYEEQVVLVGYSNLNELSGALKVEMLSIQPSGVISFYEYAFASAYISDAKQVDDMVYIMFEGDDFSKESIQYVSFSLKDPSSTMEFYHLTDYGMSDYPQTQPLSSFSANSISDDGKYYIRLVPYMNQRYLEISTMDGTLWKRFIVDNTTALYAMTSDGYIFYGHGSNGVSREQIYRLDTNADTYQKVEAPTYYLESSIGDYHEVSREGVAYTVDYMESLESAPSTTRQRLFTVYDNQEDERILKRYYIEFYDTLLDGTQAPEFFYLDEEDAFVTISFRYTLSTDTVVGQTPGIYHINLKQE